MNGPASLLQRLLRQQQFQDHDARLRPTEAEKKARRPHANKSLSQEAAQVTRAPRLFIPT